MAFNVRNKRKKFEVKDIDLLPVMNLFSILIPFLLSVAVFERLGILEISMPERSAVSTAQSDVPDPGNLNLTLIVTDKYLTVGANGGFLPQFYYREEVTYRSKSDGKEFTVPYVKGEVVKSPSDGKVMSSFERYQINLYYLDKKDSTDPGVTRNIVYNSSGEALIDASGNFLSEKPTSSTPVMVIGEAEAKPLEAREMQFLKIAPLSVYDEIARQLWNIKQSAEKRENPPEDIDKIMLLASPHIIYDKIVHSMDAAKYAGFHQIALSLLGS